MRPADFLSTLEKRFQLHAGRHPALFFAAYSLLRRDSRQAVDRETEILIEGFPRSANSFAVEAFRLAQRSAHRKEMRGRRREARSEGIPPNEVVERFRATRVANHLHVPAQVIRASRLGIPTLVLIREPVGAVVSYQIRDGISASLALKSYISFYETVEPYSDSFVLGRFGEVTRNFGRVVERVNARFGTDFTPFARTEKNVREVFETIDRVYERKYDEDVMEAVVSRPSEERAAIKHDFERRLRQGEERRLLARAEAVHARLTALSET